METVYETNKCYPLITIDNFIKIITPPWFKVKFVSQQVFDDFLQEYKLIIQSLELKNGIDYATALTVINLIIVRNKIPRIFNVQ